jgi:hypothetical protein
MGIMSERIARCAISVLSGLLIAPGYIQAKDPVQCPPQLHVRQQIDASLPGWSAVVDQLPNFLAGLTFFDGKPKITLRSRQTSKPSKTERMWQFGISERMQAGRFMLPAGMPGRR